MRTGYRLAAMLISALLCCGSLARGADNDGFVDAFNVTAESFESTGRGDYYVLEPGFQLVYVTKDGDRGPRLVTTVLPETATVNGVETRVVESVELAGEL